MGGWESVLSSRISVADLEGAVKESGASSAEQSKHGWQAKSSSPQISISSDKLTATLKKTESGVQHRVTGSSEYSDGVHLFQFKWKPDKDKKLVVGVCTKGMGLVEGKTLLGGDDGQSIGWNIMERKVYYNGCVTTEYPKTKTVHKAIPEKFVMILNLDQGTLSFKAEGDDLGVAMSGLKHIASEFLVAASLSVAGDVLEMKYLGGSDIMKGHRKLEIGQPDDGNFRFHKICGQNIILTENNTKAQRKNPRKTYNSATVMTNRALCNGESVEIEIDEMDTSNWTSSLVLGVTTVPPESLQFPMDAMSEVSQGDTWAVRMQELKHNGKHVQETAFDLDDAQAGDIFKLTLDGSKVTIVRNTTEVTHFTVDNSKNLYGCVDVYGQTASVSISGGTNITIPNLLAMMEKKNMQDIPAVLNGINIHLSNPKYGINGRKKNVAANELTKGTVVQTLKTYMEFLISKHAKNSQSSDCYKALISLLLCYTNVNLQLAQALGTTGLLSLLMTHLTKMDHDIFDTKKNKQNLEEVLMVLHNAAQAKENREVFQMIKFVEHAEKILQNKHQHGNEAAITAVLAMSYVCVTKESPKLKLDKDLSRHAVDTINKTVSDANHTYKNWTTFKLLSGIGKVAHCKPSASALIQQGFLGSILQVLDFTESNDKECALNVLWELINDDTMVKIFADGKLMSKVQAISKETDDSVRQAARRVLGKMPDGQVLPGNADIKCQYQELCERFKASLNLSEAYFGEEYDMCYCEDCYSRRGDDATYSRGEPEKSYGLPVGWCRFGLKAHPKAGGLEAFKKWHRAYHGTRVDSVKSILEVGEIAPAGRKVLGGKNITELDGHFKDGWKPAGFNTKRVFLSPSMRYSGVHAYAKPQEFKDSSDSYTAQVAFQVLVNPNSYSVEKETIGAGLRVIDPNFNNAELEWVVEEQGAVIHYGLLVKLSKE